MIASDELNLYAVCSTELSLYCLLTCIQTFIMMMNDGYAVCSTELSLYCLLTCIQTFIMMMNDGVHHNQCR